MEQPEPSGARGVPPDKLKTAIAAASGDNRWIVLHLLDPAEEEICKDGLEHDGWQVLPAHDAFDVVVAGIEGPAILFTDDPQYADFSRDDLEAGTAIFVLVDDRDSAIEGAWRAGADWVVTRPIDRSDPLRIKGIGPYS